MPDETKNDLCRKCVLLQLEIQQLKARNAELTRDAERLTILGNGRATGLRGFLARHFGFWRREQANG